MRHPSRRSNVLLPRRAFTLLETLVVVAAVAALAAILLTSLTHARSAARDALCAANLHQISTAISLHLADHDQRLPQVYADMGGGATYHIGVGFGGAAGSTDILGLASLTPDRRPLNAYLASDNVNAPAQVFQDPADTGGLDPFLVAADRSEGAIFDLVGNSYTLNGAALDDIPCPFVDASPTFALGPGRPMPAVVHPARTWLVGDLPILNYDDAGDRLYTWHARNRSPVRANLAFADGHVSGLFEVPDPRNPSVGLRNANTTPDYTFFPAEPSPLSQAPSR